MKLMNKTILVTGGTSGIGRELVRLLAPRNHLIIVIGRSSDRLKRVEQAYANVRAYPCSLDDEQSLKFCLAEIVAEYPGISVVVNNAGIQVTSTFLDKTFRFNSIAEEITTNLTAPVWLSALMLPSMLELDEPCAFINITSGLALFPKRESAVYCATKAGLHNFSRSFRYQLESTNISVHEALLPLVDTPMTRGRGNNKISAVEVARAIIKGVERDKAEIYVGKARLLPLLARLCPNTIASFMKK